MNNNIEVPKLYMPSWLWSLNYHPIVPPSEDMYKPTGPLPPKPKPGPKKPKESKLIW